MLPLGLADGLTLIVSCLLAVPGRPRYRVPGVAPLSSSTTPPTAASKGSESCTIAARVAVRCGSAA